MTKEQEINSYINTYTQALAAEHADQKAPTLYRITRTVD